MNQSQVSWLTFAQEKEFWSCVDNVGVSGSCWIWRKGSFNQYGNYRGHVAHRLSWLLAGRELDPTLVLDHLCENKGCQNPEHLEQVTSAENLNRTNNPTLERIAFRQKFMLADRRPPRGKKPKKQPYKKIYFPIPPMGAKEFAWHHKSKGEDFCLQEQMALLGP